MVGSLAPMNYLGGPKFGGIVWTRCLVGGDILASYKLAVLSYVGGSCVYQVGFQSPIQTMGNLNCLGGPDPLPEP